MNTYRPEPAEFPDYDTANETPQAPAITMTTRQIVDLAELLEEVDEFLRPGHGIEALAASYRSQDQDPAPRFTASTLVDQVGLTALWLRSQARAATSDQEAQQ